MRHPHSVEKQNKGFSLVEVLVTLALISALSIPLIQTFINSNRLNKKAKAVQNATDVAQTVSETFQGMTSVDEIKNAYPGKVTTTADGQIVFQNIGDGKNTDKDGNDYFLGNDKEKFYVSVVLNPTEYTDGTLTTTEIDEINNYIKPGITNLDEQSSVSVVNEITKYDDNIVSTFSSKGVTVANKCDIKKTTTLRINEYQSNISVTSNGTTQTKLCYKYYLDIVYEYNGTKVEYNDNKLAIGSVYNSEDMPNIYVIYPPALYAGSEKTEANDQFIVEYTHDIGATSYTEKDVKVYFVEQSIANRDGNTVKCKASNIKIYNDGVLATTIAGNYDNSGRIKFYTNVTNWNAQAKGTLTTGTKKMTKLYTIDVYVYKDDAEGVTIDINNLPSIKTTYVAHVNDVYTNRKAAASVD